MSAADHFVSWNSRQSPDVQGYWGKVSASIDWCEGNYEISYYVAEFCNTFSNLFFIGIALFSMIMAYKERLPLRLFLAEVGIALVGIGSFAFHGTLRYDMQLADELPMIYASTLVTWVVFDVEPEGANPIWSAILPVLLLAYDVFVTIAYLKYPNPIFHQVAYAIIQLTTTFRTTQLLFTKLKSSDKERNLVKKVKALEQRGSIIFLLGFLVWNIENQTCDILTDIKMKVGLPLAWLLEGHAFWHYATGYGSWLIVAGIQALVLALREGVDSVEIKEAWGGLIVWVARTKTGKKKAGAKKE